MASGITPAQSDLSSELLLNKIMNNQVKTDSGKTITSAGRSMSAQLSATGYAAGASAGGVSSGEGYVLAAQSQATEMVQKLKEMQSLLSGVSAITPKSQDIAKSAYKLATYVGSLTGSTIDGKKLFGATGMTIDAGLGAKMTVLNRSLATTTGVMKVMMAGVKGITTATTYSSTTYKTALSAISGAISSLNNYLGDYGVSYNQLRDRSAVLNDLAQGFNESAANQAISGASGSSALLNNLLGN